jgi:transposase
MTARIQCAGTPKRCEASAINEAHELEKALLIARHQLVDMRVRIDNQLRGILKTFGLVIGKCGRGHIGQRAQELSKRRPGIDGVVASMVAVRDSLLEQIIVCDRAIRRLAKKDDTARRLMTVPGVGPVVALAYISVIDDPKRFTHARDVGAYLGLMPKRYQSKQCDRAFFRARVGRADFPQAGNARRDDVAD